MNRFTHFCAYVAVAIVLSVLLSNVADSWLGEEADYGVFHMGRILLAEARRHEALHQRLEIVNRSIEMKRAIAAETLAGRLTLSQAVEQFHDVDYSVKNNNSDLIASYMRPATEEGVYLQVLCWVQGECEGARFSSKQVKLALAPLMEEYESRFGSRPSLEQAQEVID